VALVVRPQVQRLAVGVDEDPTEAAGRHRDGGALRGRNARQGERGRRCQRDKADAERSCETHVMDSF
jgi:hypothetical protein